MQDQTILAAAIASREAWEKVRKHITASELTPLVGFWWKYLNDAYARDKQARSLDKATLRALGEPGISNPKQASSILSVLDMDEVSSPLNIVQIVLELKRKNLTAEFAAASLSGEKQKADKILEALNEVWEADSLDSADAGEWRDASAAASLFSKVGTDKRVPFACPSVNGRLSGGILPGQHVVIFGRTEIGKSSFVIDCAARLLKRQQRILYIGNEDQIDILKMRMMGRVLKVPQAELEREPERHAAEFKQYEDNLLMTQLYNGSIDSIRKRVIEWEPTVLVIDQFRNLQSDADGLTRGMESNAIKLRALLLEYGLIGISVTQANDRSERHGQEAPIYLQTGDVDSSRVGLPGQADLLIGIGANTEMKQRGQRFISFCKNKLSSEAGAHEGVVVNFDLSISRVS
jgi:hypothetical protein